MADINAKNAVTSLSADLKLRNSSTDNNATDLSGAGFLDVMIARLSTLDSDDNDVKQTSGIKDANSARDARDATILTQLKSAREKSVAKAADSNTVNASDAADQTSMVAIKEKIKARVKEIASTNDVPVINDKALKALKKVAAFLLKASQDGKIDLPPQLVQKMQDFLAKGDDLKAFDIANFMQEFAASFKTMVVALTDASTKSGGDDLTWPQDLLDQLKDLNVAGLAQPGKKITTYDAMRLVKALVNASEKSAIDTLDEKIKKAVLPQDRGSILVNSAAATKDSKTKMDADASASEQTDAALNSGIPGLSLTKDVSTATKQASLISPVFQAKNDSKGDLKDNASLLSQPSSTPALSAALRVQLSGAISVSGEVSPAAALSSISSGMTNTSMLDSLYNVNTSASTRFAAVLNATAQNNAAASAPSEATQQVIVQLQSRGGKAGSLSVQLTPLELGRVDIRVSTDRSGNVRTVIAADRPETLALLQKDSALLEKSLQQAGINANAGSMSFNLREQRQSQSESGRKRFARDDLEEVSTKDVALNINTDAIISNDHVNYHA